MNPQPAFTPRFMQMKMLLNTLLHAQEKSYTLFYEAQWIVNWNPVDCLCVKADFISTLNKLLEE